MKSSRSSASSADLEKGRSVVDVFRNDEVQSIAWSNLSKTVPDTKLGISKRILSGVSGYCQPGELVAIMGASGSGKTTLLNCLAQRIEASAGGEILINGGQQPGSHMRRLSAFVEQQDALIGSLTAAESLEFAARLALGRSVPSHEIRKRAEQLLAAFGLESVRNTPVGTRTRKGLSGGQQRRVSVARQLMTAPRVLFLDEMTTGLDSKSSWEVVKFVRNVAKRYNLLIFASIHQPSSRVFECFDKVCLLSKGQTCFFGQRWKLEGFFSIVGVPIPQKTNPAEFVLDVTNIDFVAGEESSHTRLLGIQDTWQHSTNAAEVESMIKLLREKQKGVLDMSSIRANSCGILYGTLVLVHRGFLKSTRDALAYWIRLVMYTGLALLVGTVWLRLPAVQDSIQPIMNSLFFSSAFMSLLAVAYIPSYLEDRASFIRERSTGLYTALTFCLSNFLLGLPHLFLISLVYTSISYPLINLNPAPSAFFTTLLFNTLNLLTSESLVIALSSLVPTFTTALALTALVNGLWMAVAGFLVAPAMLNPFWRYVFHYVDYQSYVYQGIMAAEFEGRVYECGVGCHCMWRSAQEGECRIQGEAVLEYFGYEAGQMGKWVGVLVGIMVFYRVLGWVACLVRKT